MTRRLDEPGLLLGAGALAAPMAWLAAMRPLLALAAVGAVVLALLVLLAPRGVLLVLVAALPWEDMLHYPNATVTVVKLLGLLLLGAWLLRALATRAPLRLSAALLPAFALGAATALALIVSPDPAAGVLDLVRYALYVAFLFLVVQIAETREDVVRILRVLVLSATLACVWALYTFLALGADRAGGPIHDPNGFAFIVGFLPPLALYLGAAEPRRRAVWWLCAALLVVTVFATLSRGELAGLGAFVVWAVATRRVPLGGVVVGLAAVAGLLVVAFALWGPLLHHRLEGKRRVAGANVASRQALWGGAVRMAADRPLLGVGPGRFGTEARVYVLDSPQAIPNPQTHNSYLQVLAESGLLGLSAFVALLATTWRLLARARRRARALGDRDGVGLTTAMQGALVIALTSAAFVSVQLTMPFWLLGGLAVVVAGAARPAAWPATSRALRPAPA